MTAAPASHHAKYEVVDGDDPQAGLLRPSLEQVHSPTATTEYAQLDIDDSESTPFYASAASTDRQRLIQDDEASLSDDEPKPLFYRLPTEGGTIFASFVSFFFPASIIISLVSLLIPRTRAW